MRRMRVIAMTVLTLAALMSLGIAVGVAAKGGHGLWYWADIAGCFLLASAMLAASTGLWVQWARQRWFNNKAASLTGSLAPRGKYAAWTNERQAGQVGGNGKIRSRKTLRHKN